MKEKDLIKLYFENYYPNNKKHVYQEEVSITVGLIFLFLLFLMIKSFSKSNASEVSEKIERDPQIPKKIIKNLEDIEKIITNDNPNKDLKEILLLINELDNNLNELSSSSDRNKLIEKITDQIINLLQIITQLYVDQSTEKKDRLFNELNKILSIFGLSELFLKLLKSANQKNEIKTDEGKSVKLNADNFSDLADEMLADEEDEQEDEEEEVDEEPLNLGSDEDLEREDILNNKTIDQIKEEIIGKKRFIEDGEIPYIRKMFNYIINNFDKYEDNLIKDLYVYLYQSENDIDTFDSLFKGTTVFNLTVELIEEEQQLKSSLSDYDKLLLFLKSKNIYVEEISLGNRKEFLIKIDINKYRTGKIFPLKINNHETKCYYLVFYEKGTFNIYIDPKDIPEYKLYDSFFQFVLNENTNISNFEILFSGKWKYDDSNNKIDISVLRNTIPTYDEINIEEISKDSKTYILKDYIYSNKLKEIKNADINPKIEETYWYCIKYDENTYYIKKIEGDFLSYLREIYNRRSFSYQGSSSLNININFSNKSNLVDLIFIDSHVRGKGNYNFLNKISNNKSPLILNKEFFQKINITSKIKNAKLLEFNTSNKNWVIGGE